MFALISHLATCNDQYSNLELFIRNKKCFIQDSNINSKYPIRLIIFAGSMAKENSISVKETDSVYSFCHTHCTIKNQNQGHHAEKHCKSVKTRRIIAFGIFQKQKVIKRGRREMSQALFLLPQEPQIKRKKWLQAPCLLIGWLEGELTKANSGLFLDGIVLNILP